jgi:predicted HD superfamily hydrolase involved in NAD metabolism
LLDHLVSGLRPGRFLHVLGVTHTAVQLAAQHGLHVELAAAAGLIHDRSKELPPARIEEELGRQGIQIPVEDRDYPAIWHGLHAAAWLRRDSGWDAGPELEALAEAVEHHSTGDSGLGPLGRLLFVADYLEPGRHFDGIGALRDAAAMNLETAYKSCLAAKCRYMIQKGRTVHPRALRALEACGIRIADIAGAAL